METSREIVEALSLSGSGDCCQGGNLRSLSNIILFAAFRGTKFGAATRYSAARSCFVETLGDAKLAVLGQIKANSRSCRLYQRIRRPIGGSISMSAGKPEQDNAETLRIVASPSQRRKSEPNWLRHKFKAAKVDDCLVEGATEEYLARIRGGLASLRSHLSHLKKEHGLSIKRVRVGDQVFLRFNPNPEARNVQTVLDPASELDVLIHEGRLLRGVTTRYERKPQIRRKCLEHHGYACAVCRCDFKCVYGDLGENFIHVHHLNPLAAIKDAHVPDPVNDMRPVCPNCHAMLHRGGKLRSIEELKATMACAASKP